MILGLIGDYIHLTAAGYNMYGIYRKQKESNFNFQQAKTTELNNIKGKIKTGVDVKSMEDKLNDFFANINSNNPSINTASIFNEVVNQLQSQFNNTLGHITSTGDIIMSQQMKDNAISQLQKHAVQNSKNQRLRPEEVRTKVNQLQQVLQNLVNSTESGTHTAALKLAQELKEIRRQADDLYGRLVNADKIPRGTKNVLEKEKNLKNKINNAITAYAAYPALALQKGEFFEYLVPYVMGTANGLGLNEIRESMNDIKVGGKNENISIQTDNFGIAEEVEGGSQIIHSFNFDKDVLSVKSSQGKVDIILDLNDEKIGASLKNINLSKKGSWIHTVSGSNLLFFLQDIHPDFVNHYININATHIGKENISSSLRAESRQAMKAVLAAKAITGANAGRQAADVFIVNDNKTGKVRIVTMEKIIDSLNKLKDLSEVSVRLNNKNIMGQNLFVNKSISDDDRLGIQRISVLLNSLRQIQLSSSISGALFKNIHES
ncbi:MAG: hypothetical protein J6T10_18715 [Methanobrevibacter sp.]|nr:hypothetical protein [Methanobrevibacter sp.]